MSEAITRELRSDSPEHTQRIAAALAKSLRPGDVIALEGELGAGKTCFVRGLAQGLGLDPAHVASPTFVLSHEYEPADTPTSIGGAGAGAGGTTLVHIDAYRLHGPSELDAVGWQELIEGGRGRGGDTIIAIEWPSRVVGALPIDRIDVRIEHAGESSRIVSISVPPTLADRVQHIAAAVTATSTAPLVACRTCGVKFDRSAKTFPFCSDRCRMADLGQWFREGYRTTRAMEQDDELSE